MFFCLHASSHGCHLPMWGVGNRMIPNCTQSLDTVAAMGVLNGHGNALCIRTPRCHMDLNDDKLQQAVLALLHLNVWNDKSGTRAWKGFPWDVMDQLHEKGYIS